MAVTQIHHCHGCCVNYHSQTNQNEPLWRTNTERSAWFLEHGCNLNSPVPWLLCYHSEQWLSNPFRQPPYCTGYYEREELFDGYVLLLDLRMLGPAPAAAIWIGTIALSLAPQPCIQCNQMCLTICAGPHRLPISTPLNISHRSRSDWKTWPKRTCKNTFLVCPSSLKMPFMSIFPGMGQFPC